jgi:hypothetical protein
MKRKAGRKAKSARARRPRPARAAAKTKPANSVDALVVASAQALGLTLDPAWHGSVAFNLRLILRHAALVDEFALPDDAEPAPVFHA